MSECDLPVILISKNTLSALFAKHELKRFFSTIILGEKKWFIIRLDDVDPNDIVYGLGDYLYYDYTPDKLDKLIDRLQTKIEKC